MNRNRSSTRAPCKLSCTLCHKSGHEGACVSTQEWSCTVVQREECQKYSKKKWSHEAPKFWTQTQCMVVRILSRLQHNKMSEDRGTQKLNLNRTTTHATFNLHQPATTSQDNDNLNSCERLRHLATDNSKQHSGSSGKEFAHFGMSAFLAATARLEEPTAL